MTNKSYPSPLTPTYLKLRFVLIVYLKRKMNFKKCMEMHCQTYARLTAYNINLNIHPSATTVDLVVLMLVRPHSASRLAVYGII